MNDDETVGVATDTKPILLYNDECAVCRRIAEWVRKAAKNAAGQTRLIERPIGDDPAVLRLLNPHLTLRDAYATIHLLMPDGSMRLGGEAVAEVLRRLPATRWFARSFSVKIFGWRPCQSLLNLAYLILADSRPIFGCESCGTAAPWVRPFVWLSKLVRAPP
jgi:predicted DCC family thiol-disulfide oxidoreductase YuxK